MRGFRGWGWRGPGPPIGIPFEMNDQSPQAQGILAWWPTLGSAGANTLRDFGGRGLHGTFKGAGEPAWVGDAQFGMALDFDGNDDYVSIGDVAPLKITGAMSISCWVNHQSQVSYQGIVSKGGNNATASYTLVWSGGQVIFLQSQTGAGWDTLIVSSVIITDTNWHHIAATNDLATARLYIDGVVVGTDTTPATSLWDNSANVLVGAEEHYSTHVKGRFHNGPINEVTIYSRALTAAQVWQSYDPATRWDLYRPLLRRLWAVPSVGGWPRILGRPVSAVSPAAPLVRRYLP